jgi:hypothetical protein
MTQQLIARLRELAKHVEQRRDPHNGATHHAECWRVHESCLLQLAADTLSQLSTASAQQRPTREAVAALAAFSLGFDDYNQEAAMSPWLPVYAEDGCEPYLRRSDVLALYDAPAQDAQTGSAQE